MQNLVATVLGNRNSGKSSTWNYIFEKTVKTGTNLRRLYFSKTEYIEVFLVSGSPEERDLYVGDIIGAAKPRVILCSMQYHFNVHRTIGYFRENDYMIYCQWLNPGYHDGTTVSFFDDLGLSNQLLASGSIVSIRNGKTDLTDRCEELLSFIYGWAYYRGLILIDNG